MEVRERVRQAESIPAVIWKKFLEQLEPQINFRIAHFCLQKSIQEDSENIDEFLARCLLQAKECKFRNEKETEEWLIIRTKHLELQKQLLSKDQTLSVQEVLDICRVHKTSIHYMSQLADMQNHEGEGIDAINHTPRDTKCRRRGGFYTPTPIDAQYGV